MAWGDITGKPNFLSVNSTDITLDNGNNQATKNISSQMSGYKAVIPVLINRSSGNWDLSIGIEGNILIAPGPRVISGYETVVRLYRFK